VGLSLDQWQGNLENHFRALADKRATSGFHIFALEHGLTEAEIEEIGVLLRARLRSNERLSTHWLAWVVYATEQGYHYAGGEYWQSFEEHTPFWQDQNRYNLASWFRKFQQTYDSVVPTGPWASHFRIIAWPITHAILPRYLQHQFARALYDLRFRLASLTRLEPVAIGKMLATYAHSHASSRFEEFLQQEELTGRIVLALLGETAPGTIDPINPPTLDRIVTDLEKVRHGGEWLKEARRVVRDRFIGIGHGTGPPGLRPGIPFNASPGDAQRHNIKPSLLLRSSGAGTWSVMLDIPDFKAVATDPVIRDFLRTTRSYVSGLDSPRPGGWLLGGSRKAILTSWPQAKCPLIRFERSLGVVENLVSGECRMSDGPIWLFRIGIDGLAREITGRIVRPGSDYIVATSAALPDLCPWIEECQIDCRGVQARRVRVPAQISQQDDARIKSLGLQVAKTIRVWPAGLPGRGWDGEGSSEWLTTESPCFGIVHDHVIAAYIVRLNNGVEVLIEAGRVGFPTFVRLPSLPAGRHHLSVTAKRSSYLRDETKSPEAEGFLVLNVREPEAWRPGRPFHTGLVVTLDPVDADLDAFWENRISLSILGPESHHVHCRVTLTKSDGTELLSGDVGDAFPLPVTPESWRKQLERFVSRENSVAKFLEATSGCLTIRGDELGEFRIPFERKLPPVRWALRKAADKITIRAIDDAGQQGAQLRSYFRSMERPLSAAELSSDHAHAGIDVVPPGGLFVAELDTYRDDVIVSTGLTGTGLQGLSVSPAFPELDDGSISLAQACRNLPVWNDARLTGFLADARRQKVVEGLASAIYGQMCGGSWARAEAQYRSTPKSVTAIDALQRQVHRYPGFAAALRRNYLQIDDPFSRSGDWFADLARRHDVCPDKGVSEGAICLAGNPALFTQLAGDDLDALLEEIRGRPAVLRGARMFALLRANEGNDGPARLLPRWDQ
jgi:hypothetical protein